MLNVFGLLRKKPKKSKAKKAEAGDESDESDVLTPDATSVAAIPVVASPVVAPPAVAPPAVAPPAVAPPSVGRPVYYAAPSSSSDTSSVSQPFAAPALMAHLPTIKMYEGAEGTDVQEADFSVIHGNDFSNAPLAALQNRQNMPVTPPAQRASVEIMKGAKNTNARRAVFSVVGGNRYGSPLANTATDSSPNSIVQYESLR